MSTFEAPPEVAASAAEWASYVAHASSLLKWKEVKTPFIEESVASQLGTDDEREKGILASSSCSILVKLLFAASQARPDLMYSIIIFARRVACWRRIGDHKLHRLISYVKCEPHEDERFHALRRHYEKMASLGFRGFVRGMCIQRQVYDWSLCFFGRRRKLSAHLMVARRQVAVSHSSAESESVAMSTALRTVLIPLCHLMESISGHEIECTFEEDNAAEHRIAEIGFSAALLYMQKTHRIAVSFNHETCERQNIKVEKRSELKSGELTVLRRLSVRAYGRKS